MKSSLIYLILVFCTFNLVSAQVDSGCAINNSLIPNGDFNNPATGMPYTSSAYNFAPPPWTKSNTSDLSTETEVNFDGLIGSPSNPSFNFDPSPTGGSFMGFRTSRTSIGTTNEGMFNTLTVADASEQITIRFDYTEAEISFSNTIDPNVNIVFRINATSSTSGDLIANVPNLASTGGTNGTWEERTITFIPSSFGISDGDTVNFFLGSFESADFTWAFVDGLGVVNSSSICFSCAIDDPGAISGTCTGSNDLEFSTIITGSNTGSTYMVTGATPTMGTYGTPTTFTIASGADGANKTITIIDDTDGMCTRDITITGVAACFSCDSGADGPRFLGLTTSTWSTLGIITVIGAGASIVLKKFVF